MTHIFSQVPLPLAYGIGALLYTPANRVSVADSICHQRFGTKFSLALCLEDTINDAYLPQAEQQAIQTIQTIYQKRQQEEFYLPRLFIRLRSPKQIAALLQPMGQAAELLTGFIFPKFSLENASAYLAALENANHISRSTPFFMMPVLEDASLLSLRSRVETLEQLKDLLQPYYQQVLNIRVGCNDLCHLFGLRRHPYQTIYDILPVANILSDILTVFQPNYVVSAPVWEYFQDETELWKTGLKRELELDLLNGFIGKTVIHPSQIAVVNEGLKVSSADYADACQILNWNPDNPYYVSGGAQTQRMNEYKTHHRWAQRILLLAEYYGIRQE